MKKILFLFIITSFIFVGCSNETDKEEYGKELNTLVESIIDNSVSAEDMTNTYAFTWSKTINGTLFLSDLAERLGVDEWVADEYFTTSGFDTTGIVVDDYNLVISELNNFYSEQGNIEELQTNSNEIKEKIKELNNPPEEYKEVYDKVVKLYTTSEEYIQLAISPSGSLVSYNENRNKLSNDIVSLFKEIDAIMPSEKSN